MTNPESGVDVSGRMVAGPRIDAHLHLWNRQLGDYSWLTPELGALYADFTPGQAKVELDAAGIDSAILVQADDTLADTEHLLDVASAQPWVAGVVGWVPLDDPAAAEAALDRWQQHPAFVGVRHLVHDDPRDDFLSLPAVRQSLALLAARGVAFDVPDAWPRHLGATVALAEALPHLTIVLDHLGKPPRGTDALSAWDTQFRRLAAQPNVVAKVSGLHTVHAPFNADALRTVWDVALEAFGPGRLLYGGDWPISVTAGGYSPTWRVVSELIGELSPTEQHSILAQTATETYQLP
ncbi:amidohydrolase family protein [Leifsonia sp. A12D58]|uniref:amidohydrolase family protein n=1 Tax=Leifsonia sp. A12D58 TaxID=3397674 RepID=UPI0039E1516A